MDDYNIGNLYEAKNEYCARLVNILTPQIQKGIQSLFLEAKKLCFENEEESQYLVTFQNFLSRIPKWNQTIIDDETNRILSESNCSYLEDLITCVHVIQLKLLTAVRVGSKQKKIDIVIPKIEDFIHKVYIISARKIYKNVYLFEKNIPPLQVQKNNREVELLIQEAILNAVRESIPVDVLLRTYLDESIEEDVQIDIHEEVLDDPSEEIVQNSDQIRLSPTIPPTPVMDVPPAPPVEEVKTLGQTLTESEPVIPKKLEEEPEDLSQGKLVISSEQALNLDHTDLHSLDPPTMEVIPDLLIDDIEMI